MDKDVKEFLDFLKGDECNIWELGNYFEDKEDAELLKKIFNPVQFEVLKVIVSKTIWALDEWHNQKDDSAHQDIRDKIAKIEAHLRNHRHDYSKTFTGKAEY